MSQQEHKAQAPAAVPCYVVTVSDTRTAETDLGGRTIRELLESAGHAVTGHAIVRDEPVEVAALIRRQIADGTTRVIITTGGTGITSRDGTFEAISHLLDPSDWLHRVEHDRPCFRERNRLAQRPHLRRHLFNCWTT